MAEDKRVSPINDSSNERASGPSTPATRRSFVAVWKPICSGALVRLNNREPIARVGDESEQNASGLQTDSNAGILSKSFA